MKYPILRSGFITFTQRGLRQPNQPTDDLSMSILGKERLIVDNDNFFHDNIQKLFVQCIKDAHLNGLNNNVVQENILKAAAEAFGKEDGTANFFDWIMLQEINPGMTSIHQKFLMDTCEYLTGKKRDLAAFQWIPLLEAGTSENRSTLRTSNYHKKMEEFRRSGVIPHKLSDVLVRWVRQERGFYDLMMSLEAIFGNRRTFATG